MPHQELRAPWQAQAAKLDRQTEKKMWQKPHFSFSTNWIVIEAMLLCNLKTVKIKIEWL